MAVAAGQGSAPTDQIAAFRSDGFSAKTGLRVPFFSEGFSRAYGFPEVRLRNMISEATELREDRPYGAFVGLRDIRYSRPALVNGYNWGDGPIRGMVIAPSAAPFSAAGFFLVSGTTIYNRQGAAKGTIPGVDLVRFATSRTQVVAVAGGVAYLFEGTGTFTAIASDTLPAVSDVAYLAGRFVYQAQGSDRFYWSEVNDAANINALNFATAESGSDNTLGLTVLNEELVFFGSQTVEFWQPNLAAGIADSAFIPIAGRGYPRGCASRDSIAHMDNTVFWVGDNRVVYRAGTEPTRVSSNSIDDKLRQCADPTTITGWAATFEGHDLYVLGIPGVGTCVYDASRVGQGGAYPDYERGEWAEWTSFGRDTGFRGHVAVTLSDVTYVGDDATNDVWTMKTGVYRDGNDDIARIASAFIKIEEGTPRCDNLVLNCVQGVGNATPPGLIPVAEMRYSDDMGRTFSKWRSAPLGRMGDYTARAFWQRLGTMRSPGRLVEVRVSDPVNAVYSHLELNSSRPAQ